MKNFINYTDHFKKIILIKLVLKNKIKLIKLKTFIILIIDKL